MGILWNRELKKLALALLAISAAALMVINFITTSYRFNQNREYTIAVAELVDSVMEAYPETSEESLMQVLNQRGSAENAELLLSQYGVFLGDEDQTFAAQKQRSMLFQWGLNLFVIALAACIIGVVFYYLARRQMRLQGICNYMEELVRGNYYLDIQDNGDDELSGLKNEVYKLTVSFREQAQRAVENRKALADSVADISHQLKTPLTSVTVLVDNLSESEEMSENTRRRFLTEITRQLAGVNWLVTTMLKLSRLEAGVVELEHNPLSVAALTEEVCEKLELNAEWNQVELCADIPGEIEITGDFQWLSEAILNIVKNAIEHSPAGKTVELRAEANDIYTLLTVHNWGTVIPKDEQRQLFERFYRGETSRPDSVGIGLALAREIIIRLGGYVTVESEEGRGTTFFIKFLKCH